MQGNRWILENDKIIWNCSGDSHLDTIEMAGNQIAAIVTYGVNDTGTLSLHRELRYQAAPHIAKRYLRNPGVPSRANTVF